MTEGRVFWDAPAPASGLCRVTLFEDDDRVVLCSLRRRRYPATSGDSEFWSRTTGGTSVTYSLRRGRLDVYCIGRSRAGLRPVMNVSTDLRFTERFTQELLFEEAEQEDLTTECREAIADALIRRADDRGLRSPDDPYRIGVSATLAALSYPLLGLALDQGCAPPDTLPTSVSTTLRRPTARQAARHAFGARATRRLTRELPRSLVVGPPSQWSDARPLVNLVNLEVAIICRAALEPDQLADLLGHPPAEDALGPQLDRAQLAVARRYMRGLSPARVPRLARQAIATRNGGVQLRDLVNLWDGLGRPDPTALPRDLTEAHDVLADQHRQKDVPELTLDAYPDALRSLDGHKVADLRLVVPSSTTELAAWGEQLHNCLSSYVTRAWTGATWLLGAEHDGGLRYAIEIEPGRGLRQFLGPRNAQPDNAHVAAVSATLTEAGLLNRPSPAPRPPHPQLISWQHRGVAGDFLIDEEPF